MLKRWQRWWRHVAAQGQLTRQARDLLAALGDPAAQKVKDDEIRTLAMQLGVAHLANLARNGFRYDPEAGQQLH